MEGKTRLEKAIIELVEAFLERIEDSDSNSAYNVICPYYPDYCPLKGTTVEYPDGTKVTTYSDGTSISYSVSKDGHTERTPGENDE